MILSQRPGTAGAAKVVAARFLSMITIVRVFDDWVDGDRDRWDAIVQCAAKWLLENQAEMRDAMVLVPFVQLLPLARRAFARHGGWMPRVETVETLAASLGPAASPAPGQVSFDITLDALNAATMLRMRAWGAAWARRDARGFEHAVHALVATTHELVRSAAALRPAARAAHWAAARELFPPTAGPGASERLLGRVALEWACLSPRPATDQLFDASSPGAWIVVKAGGADLLTTRLLANATVSSLVIDTDPLEDDAFQGFDSLRRPAYVVCEGFEDEAQCAAAQVLVHVERHEVPVALIAQDRVLVRRVRALLERHRLKLTDETGWKLSTTRAAALVMGLLQAARPDATTDALLSWLKAGTDDDAALNALEATCRRAQISRATGLANAKLDTSVARLWSAASAVLDALRDTQPQPLAAWLVALSTALENSGALAVLQADDAGIQVLAALKLKPSGGGVDVDGHPNRTADAEGWTAACAQSVFTMQEFNGWVDGALERATFRPEVSFDNTPDVIVTPLGAAMLRPFAAIVLPGADNKHLGAAAPSISLLSDVQAAALGVITQAERRRAELYAFAQLASSPRLTLLRRRVDAGDPLADSLLVERLSIALAKRGVELSAWQDPRVDLELTATPVHMSSPSAPALLPARLSASACEMLRACPYRFFAFNMLKLREDDELEREVDKRDYGTWLHAVLFAFHAARKAPATRDADLGRLLALAREGLQARGLAGADFLPFLASFESFAPRYVAWLQARDADGARWLSGEDEIVFRPDGFGNTELRGIIDRVDELHGGASIELIDYKTGGAASLREKVKEPLEDTQLAFYAALMRSRTELPLTARYVALDGSRGIEEVEHRGIEASAAALVAGLADDLRQLRTGAGLPALGAGSACDFCAARGICRRDHWADGA